MATRIAIDLSYMSPVPHSVLESHLTLLIIPSIADTPTINTEFAPLTFSLHQLVDHHHFNST